MDSETEMIWFALNHRGYMGSRIRINVLHFVLIFLHWQVINTESTLSPPNNNNSVTPQRTITFKGQDYSSVEEIEILKPQNIELLCNMIDLSAKPENITGYWRMNNTEIENTRQTFQKDHEKVILKKIFNIDGSNLGNYTCIFNYLEKEEKATFVLKVPVMKEKGDRPIVTYIGDSVVLDCHMKKSPNTWKWYKYNGTEKELINATTDPMNYKIHLDKNETKLTLLNLTEDDSGKYTCSAIFDIATTESHMQLRVLSFTEPLKPFLIILAEVIFFVILILLYEKQSQRNKSQYEVTENGLPSDQTDSLTQQESSGADGYTGARQRKVEH